MRRSLILYTALTLLSLVGFVQDLKAAEGEETFQQFLTACEYAERAGRQDQTLSDDQIAEGMRCIYVVRGVILIMQGNCHLRTSGHNADDNLSMQGATTGQAIRAIVTYAQEHIDLWQKPWWLVMPWAITDKLPCKN
jgi:hypothetical protein